MTSQIPRTCFRCGNLTNPHATKPNAPDELFLDEHCHPYHRKCWEDSMKEYKKALARERKQLGQED